MELKGIINHFNKDKVININAFFEYYKSIQPDIKKNTVNWRVYELTQRGLLKRVGRGKYIIGKQTKYIPKITEEEKSINNIIKDKLPFTDYCIWNIGILNELLIHQITFSLIIIEVEKESIESVFYLLKEKGISAIRRPPKDNIKDIFDNNENMAVVIPLVSESPLQIVEGVQTVLIEKLLVDLYCEKVLFYFLQGNELVNVFRNAFDKYTINLNKLLRYAKRRGKREHVENFIDSILVNDKDHKG